MLKLGREVLQREVAEAMRWLCQVSQRPSTVQEQALPISSEQTIL